jgi:hypothetical protein
MGEASLLKDYSFRPNPLSPSARGDSPAPIPGAGRAGSVHRSTLRRRPAKARTALTSPGFAGAACSDPAGIRWRGRMAASPQARSASLLRWMEYVFSIGSRSRRVSGSASTSSCPFATARPGSAAIGMAHVFEVSASLPSVIWRPLFPMSAMVISCHLLCSGEARRMRRFQEA